MPSTHRKKRRIPNALTVLHKGNLVQETNDESGKPWQPIFGFLYNTCLEFRNSETDKELLSRIPLVSGVQVDAAPERGIKNCFKIITSIGVYYFCAASTEQMNEWITKIKRVLINNNALTTFEKKQIDLAKKGSRKYIKTVLTKLTQTQQLVSELEKFELKELTSELKTLAEGDYKIHKFECSLEEKTLITIFVKGHLYILRTVVCFYSSIFGKITKHVIELKKMKKICRKPDENLVIIHTEDTEFVFGVFRSGEGRKCFNLLIEKLRDNEIEAQVEDAPSDSEIIEPVNEEKPKQEDVKLDDENLDIDQLENLKLEDSEEKTDEKNEDPTEDDNTEDHDETPTGSLQEQPKSQPDTEKTTEQTTSTFSSSPTSSISSQDSSQKSTQSPQSTQTENKLNGTKSEKPSTAPISITKKDRQGKPSTPIDPNSQFRNLFSRVYLKIHGTPLPMEEILLYQSFAMYDCDKPNKERLFGKFYITPNFIWYSGFSKKMLEGVKRKKPVLWAVGYNYVNDFNFMEIFVKGESVPHYVLELIMTDKSYHWLVLEKKTFKLFSQDFIKKADNKITNVEITNVNIQNLEDVRIKQLVMIIAEVFGAFKKETQIDLRRIEKAKMLSEQNDSTTSKSYPGKQKSPDFDISSPRSTSLGRTFSLVEQYFKSDKQQLPRSATIANLNPTETKDQNSETKLSTSNSCSVLPTSENIAQTPEQNIQTITQKEPPKQEEQPIQNKQPESPRGPVIPSMDSIELNSFVVKRMGWFSSSIVKLVIKQELLKGAIILCIEQNDKLVEKRPAIDIKEIELVAEKRNEFYIEFKNKKRWTFQCDQPQPAIKFLTEIHNQISNYQQ